MWAFRSFVFIAVISLSFSVSAFRKKETFNVKNPARMALNPRDAKVLRMTKLERSLKNSLIAKYLRQPSEFVEQKEDLKNPPLYQSYIEEVNQCLTIGKRRPANSKGKDAVSKWLENCPVSRARDMAKKQLFLALKRNWGDVGKTIFNDFGAEDWEQARPFVLRKIQENLVFAPKSENKDNFVFHLDGAGFVEVNRKNIGKGLTLLEIGPGGNNRLEPGAENIRADVDVLPPMDDADLPTDDSSVF